MSKSFLIDGKELLETLGWALWAWDGVCRRRISQVGYTLEEVDWVLGSMLSVLSIFSGMYNLYPTAHVFVAHLGLSRLHCVLEGQMNQRLISTPSCTIT